jgi:hypothetical protein
LTEEEPVAAYVDAAIVDRVLQQNNVERRNNRGNVVCMEARFALEISRDIENCLGLMVLNGRHYAPPQCVSFMLSNGRDGHHKCLGAFVGAIFVVVVQLDRYIQ